jgi:hypothetical protein
MGANPWWEKVDLAPERLAKMREQGKLLAASRKSEVSAT